MKTRLAKNAVLTILWSALRSAIGKISRAEVLFQESFRRFSEKLILKNNYKWHFKCLCPLLKGCFILTYCTSAIFLKPIKFLRKNGNSELHWYLGLTDWTSSPMQLSSKRIVYFSTVGILVKYFPYFHYPFTDFVILSNTVKFLYKGII